MGNDFIKGDIEQKKLTIETNLTRYTKQLAWFTAILAIATIVTMGATIWIALSTKDLRDFAERGDRTTVEQLKAAKQSAEASVEQSIAAKKANDYALAATKTSQDASRLQSRAYLTLADDGNNPFEPVDIKNVGATPAYVYAAERRVLLVDVTDLNSASYKILDPRNCAYENEELLEIGSQATQNFGPDPLFDKRGNEVKASAMTAEFLKKNSMVIIVSGVICYKDIYGSRRFLQFCRYFNRPDGGSFNPCKTNTHD